MRFGRLAVTFCLLACGPIAMAQRAADSDDVGDPMARPSEYGVRFTPAMARSLAKEITKGVFVRRYELEESKADQAAELMARRFMQFAHQNEEGGQELFEFFISEMASRVANNRGQDSGGLPREVSQGLGTRLLPVMPSIRETANGVMQDVRPLLSFKQQLRLTGEVAVMNVALDAFEKNMQSWAKGDADPFGDPFRSDEADLKKDDKGETRALRNARISAEAESKNTPWSAWAEYVEDAKKYYDLDPTQAAAADSLLRDYQERAQVAVGGEAGWHEQVHRNRLLWGMSTSLRGRWSNPLRMLLDRDYERMRDPVVALGDEMKRRIEEIPTQAQRDAAEKRMAIVLKEKGLEVDEPVGTATAPAAGVEAQR